MSITSYNEHWTNIQQTILKGLYSVQIVHWNTRLCKLMQKNAAMQDVILSEAQSYFCGIQWNNKTHQCLAVNWMDPVIGMDYDFTLVDDDPDMVTELKTVINELAKLKKERYESDRFLSSMAMFTFTCYQLRDILGDHLFGLIAKASRPLSSVEDGGMHTTTPEVFLETHAFILEHMQERVLVNLLMSDMMK
jgi:hypothetical protein